MPTDTLMDITPQRVSPNGTAPAPFRVGQIYHRVWCEVEGYEGFCIDVRRGLTNQEREELRLAHKAILAYSEQWEAQPDSETDMSDTPLRRERALIAPYIKGWNAVGVDAGTGEDRAIPPPAEGGPDVYDLIEGPMAAWASTSVLVHFLAGRTLTGSKRESVPSPGITIAGNTDDPS